MSFKYKGISSTNYFVVEKITRSILPPITNNAVTVPGKPGGWMQKPSLGIRKITAVIRIRENDVNDLNTAIRTIAEWLFSEKDEELVLDKEDDKYYMARLDGETDLDEIVRIGKGTLQFICSDPIAYDRVETVVPIASGSDIANVAVSGSYKTFPIVKFTFKKPTSFFSYGTANDYEQVIMGTPVDLQEGQAAVPMYTQVINDGFQDMVGWTPGGSVEYGEVNGAMKAVNTGTGYLTYDTIGTGTAWHGPSVIQALPEPLSNWKIELFPRIFTVNANVQVRIEVYLLDVNGGVIGKMHIGDRWNATRNMAAKIRMGTQSAERNIINSHGDKPGVWNDFTGVLEFKKMENIYAAYVALIDHSKGGLQHTRLSYEWTDVKGEFANKQLAQVQIHIGAYGASPVPDPEFLYVDLLRVWKRRSMAVTEIEYVAEAGDVIEFDHYTKLITKNGKPFKQYLNPISNLFALNPGTAQIAFDPSDVADVEVSYRSRWI